MYVHTHTHVCVCVHVHVYIGPNSQCLSICPPREQMMVVNINKKIVSESKPKQNCSNFAVNTHRVRQKSTTFLTDSPIRKSIQK